MHAYNASPWETEAGIEGHSGLGEIPRSFFKAVYEYIYNKTSGIDVIYEVFGGGWTPSRTPPETHFLCV